MPDTETETAPGIATALMSAMSRKREPDPFTYEGYTLEELISLATERIAVATAAPTAESAKDLCRLSREMWNRFYDRISVDGARSSREAFFTALEALRIQAQFIRDSLSGESRVQAAASLDNITERLGDARLIMTDGFGRLGVVLRDRVLGLTRSDLPPVAV